MWQMGYVEMSILDIQNVINSDMFTRIYFLKISDFKLGEEEMQELNNLDCGEAGRFLDFRFFKGYVKYFYNFDNKNLKIIFSFRIEKHPQYPFERGSFKKEINKIFEDSKLNFDNVGHTANNEISCCK